MSVDRLSKSAYSVTVSPEQLAGARKLAEQRVVSDDAIDIFLHGLASARDQFGAQQIPVALQDIVPPPNYQRGRTDNPSINALQKLLITSGLNLSQIYKDRTLDLNELNRHGQAHAALAMFDSVRGLMPPPYQRHLEEALFAPLRALAYDAAASKSQLEHLTGNPELTQRLHHPQMPPFTALKPSDLQGHSVRGIDRYQVGDPIRVRRSPMPNEPSYVQGEVLATQGDKLVVGVPMANGVGTKVVHASNVEQHNPLKIGDWFPEYTGSLQHNGERSWSIGVVGLGKDGGLEVVARKKNDDPWFSLSDGQVAHVAATLAKQLGIAAPGSIARAPEPTPLVNGRQILDRAGGVKMVAVEAFEGERASGAVFTDHGIGYAAYNEDAAAIGRFAADQERPEVTFSITCDQAGGQGKIKDKDGRVLDGEASRIATAELLIAAESIWNASAPGFVPPKQPGPDDTVPPGYIVGDPSSGKDPKTAFLAALERAHAKIESLGGGGNTGACTTASAVVIKDGYALGVNVGDSAVLHYGADGKLKNVSSQDSFEMEIVRETKDPNAGLAVANRITRALGVDFEVQDSDFFAWKLEPGDFLVTASDGLLDANLEAQKKSVDVDGQPWTKNHGDVTNEQIGAMLSRSSTAEGAAQKLLDYTTVQMTLDDSQAYGEAKLKHEAARDANDAAGAKQAALEMQMATGSGKRDNRGFGVLQFLG